MENKLEHILKRLPEIIELLDSAWEEQNDFKLNEDTIDSAENQLKILICELTEHAYYLDQCGYWQHKFCAKCGEGEYPKLITKSCGDLHKEMGDISEEEYLEQIHLREME